MSSSAAVRSSAHIYWKKSPPNSYTLKLINQVRYELEFDEDENDGMLDVFEVNILQPKDKQKKHWRRFPASYLPFLKCMFYQFELYIDSLDSITKSRPKSSYTSNSIRKLKHYIQYMDNVIVQIWEDARIAGVKDELGPDWRCSSLDAWLRVEYHIKRHDILDVEKYIAEAGDWTSSDPFEMGKLVHIHNPSIDIIDRL
jgi:hypothetical protein